MLVEDEQALAMIIQDSLVVRGFETLLVNDGATAYGYYLSYQPDLLVLDVMLPFTTGFKIATKIRLEDKRTPIIFLTARTMPQDVLSGYESGGNDYLKKPFDMEELIIRIKVLLNENRMLEDETTNFSQNIVSIGNYTFDMLRGELSFQMLSKKLTARENDVLKILYQHRNQLLERKKFLMIVWGDDDFFSSRSLDVFITKLRKYFKNDPMIQIINHRGFGYKLVF